MKTSSIAIAVHVVGINVVAEIILLARLAVLPKLVQVLVVCGQADQAAGIAEHQQRIRPIGVLVKLRHRHAVVVIHMRHRRRGPRNLLEDLAGAAIAKHQPLLAVDHAPVRQLVAAGVMKIP